SAPDEQPDLALDLARQRAEVRRELGRRDLGGQQPTTIHALESVHLAGLEAGRVSRDGLQRALSCARMRAPALLSSAVSPLGYVLRSASSAGGFWAAIVVMGPVPDV